MGSEQSPDNGSDPAETEPYICNGIHDPFLCNTSTCDSMRKFFENETSKQGSSLRQQRRVEHMKRAALELSTHELMSIKCNSADDCFNAGNCIRNSKLGDFVAAQLAFWGHGIIESDFSKTDFNKSIEETFKSAKFEKGKVAFLISPGVYICERAMLLGLGISTTSLLCKAPSYWLKAKRNFVMINLDPEEKARYEEKERLRKLDEVGKGCRTDKYS